MRNFVYSVIDFSEKKKTNKLDNSRTLYVPNKVNIDL